MSMLLKAKSAIAIKRKDRVVYPVHDSLKRMRGDPGLANSQSQPQTSSFATGQTNQPEQPPKKDGQKKKVGYTVLNQGDTEMNEQTKK